MNVTISIGGTVTFEITRDECRNSNPKAIVDKWITPEVEAKIQKISDENALTYLNAIGTGTTDKLQPTVLTFEEDEYLPSHQSDDDFFDNRQDGIWTCSNCGAQNSVSQDQGCTSCDF